MKTLWQLLMNWKKYRELKESVREMNTQRRDAEKINLNEEGKKLLSMKLLILIKLLIIVQDHKYGTYV